MNTRSEKEDSATGVISVAEASIVLDFSGRSSLTGIPYRAIFLQS